MNTADPTYMNWKRKSVDEYLQHFRITVTHKPSGAEINIICRHCGHTYKDINVASEKTVKMIVSKSINHLNEKHKIFAYQVSSFMISEHIRNDLLGR